MKTYRIVAINLGSSSTKIAYYENDICKLKTNLVHKAKEIEKFDTIWDQYEYRLQAIEGYLKGNNIEVSKLDAVVTRGGHSEPITGGVYKINKKMLIQSASGKYGNHATDLGLKIAVAFSQYGPLPLTVDPPVTDEFEPLARYSGLPELPRHSSFHALNHRAVGKQYAKDIGKRYDELNLVVAHMGGGITVVAHKKGKMVDANNGLCGEGPFCTNRTGALPAEPLVEMCFSGEYTFAQMKRKINGLGGMMAYLGENDVLTVESRAAAGDEKCSEVLDAMSYQTAKEIGACAAVLSGKVDAILITGGIAHSKRITGFVKGMVGFIAPVILYPGEYEMQSLCLNSLEALQGVEPIKEI
jgi:butyrate kinase